MAQVSHTYNKAQPCLTGSGDEEVECELEARPRSRFIFFVGTTVLKELFARNTGKESILRHPFSPRLVREALLRTLSCR